MPWHLSCFRPTVGTKTGIKLPLWAEPVRGTGSGDGVTKEIEDPVLTSKYFQSNGDVLAGYFRQVL